MLHELRPHGIFAHVVEFLLHLRAGVDVEVVVAALPEAAEFAALLWKAEQKLPRALAFSGSQGAGDTLLEALDDLGWTCAAGLAQKQVHMLGHENVANEGKAVARSSLLKRVNGQIASPNCVQKRPALIAAKEEEGPTLSKTERVGHPGGRVYYVSPTVYK